MAAGSKMRGRRRGCWGFGFQPLPNARPGRRRAGQKKAPTAASAAPPTPREIASTRSLTTLSPFSRRPQGRRRRSRKVLLSDMGRPCGSGVFGGWSCFWWCAEVLWALTALETAERKQENQFPETFAAYATAVACIAPVLLCGVAAALIFARGISRPG